MAVLAIVQGVFGLLRAYNWVQIGTNLFGQGLLLVPFLGVMAVARGVFISIVALLYVLFAIGVFLGKSWHGGPVSRQSSSIYFLLWASWSKARPSSRESPGR